MLTDILQAAGLSSARITRTLTTPDHQAEIMYDAGQTKSGLKYEYKLYADPGRQVLDTMVEDRDAGMTRDAIIADMVQKINTEGPENVSTHLTDPSTVEGVLDVSARSIGNAAAQARFLQAAEKDPRIDHSQLFGPNTIPRDRSFHLVIPTAKPPATSLIPSINGPSPMFGPTTPVPSKATAAPGVLILGASQLTFTAVVGSTVTASLPLDVGNIGPPGSVLQLGYAASTDRIQISFPYASGINAGYKGTASISVNVSGLAPGSFSAWIDFADMQTPAVRQRVLITVNIVAVDGGGSGAGGNQGGTGYGWCSTCPPIV